MMSVHREFISYRTPLRGRYVGLSVRAGGGQSFTPWGVVDQIKGAITKRPWLIAYGLKIRR